MVRLRLGSIEGLGILGGVSDGALSGLGVTELALIRAELAESGLAAAESATVGLLAEEAAISALGARSGALEQPFKEMLATMPRNTTWCPCVSELSMDLSLSNV